MIGQKSEFRGTVLSLVTFIVLAVATDAHAAAQPAGDVPAADEDPVVEDAVAAAATPADEPPEGHAAGGGAGGTAAKTTASDCYESQENRGTFKDCRSRFGARFALGLGIDNFASGQLLNVLNPEDSDANDTRERFVGGFDIQYRLWHDKGGKNTQSVWVRALTLHGVRSTEVDCTTTMENQTLPAVCSLQSNAFDPSDINVGESATYILREASSLEGFGGLRYEFRSLESRDASDVPSGVLYLIGQLGFLSVADSGDDLIDNHLVGIGAAATEGNFRNSFLELGWGRTQLYGDKSDDRFKVRAGVNWEVSTTMRGFAMIVIDTDFGSGSDSVQSYIGMSFDIGQLTVKKKKEKTDTQTADQPTTSTTSPG